MQRGRLRVMLGAAPGVGKTYAMLEEGRLLRDGGEDVVVAVVETHGRSATSALVDGLEVIPRRRVEHRGVTLEELDVDTVLARQPRIALVDELAHTDVPGSPHAKRWEDVEQLLDAGIDVISTVNIQHIESLNDVVERITGVPQRETIPDHVLRRADRIELVDLAPEALRNRLSEGLVYPAARVDAALSNYFRLGNLTALRELALLWLADEVDSALQAYRAEHGIRRPWEARERIVVTLTGGPEGETLLRRGARIAQRSGGGTLYAVHVVSPDGLEKPGAAALAAQRSLVESLGGTFHQVIAERVPTALVQFARSVDATQLVVGVSRRSRLARLIGGAGTSASVIRSSGDIDVHIVSHAEAGSLGLPRLGGALSLRRQVTGFALAAIALPLLAALLSLARSTGSLPVDTLLFQLTIVVVALVGGIWPGLFSAVVAGFLLDFFFIPPLYVVRIADPLHALALVIFVIVAALVSVVVDQAARRARVAARASAEAEVLVAVAGGVLSGADALHALVARLREAFGLERVALLQDDTIVASDEDPGLAHPESMEAIQEIGENAHIALRGRPLEASDRRVLGAFASQLEAALVQRRLSTAAADAAPLVEADRLRSALLAAVGHDLRRPLAAARAAVTSLRAPDGGLRPHDREELLETADESLDALGRLVSDLLDVSRLQAGVIGVHPRAVELDQVVVTVLDALKLAPGQVALELGPVGTGDPGETSRRRVPAVPAPGRHRQQHWPGARTRPREGLRRSDGRQHRGGGHPGRRAHDGGGARGPPPGRGSGGGPVRVLVADDDPQILRALRITLAARGYDVETAADGASAIAAAGRTHPDLLVLDLGMPGLSGVQVIEAVRGWSDVPILVVSGRTESWDKVEALDAGADDYVTKPFAIDELLARVRALTRRAATAPEEPVVAFGDVVVDLAARRVTRDGAPVRLTPTEWRLLEALVRNPDRLLTRETLLTRVWGPQYTTDTGYLRLYIAQLRKKLEEDTATPRYLRTESGMGYRFTP